MNAFCPNVNGFKTKRLDTLYVGKSLDEWEAERTKRIREEARVQRVEPPPVHFDPTQFDIFPDGKEWSQNVNNPYVAAKLAADYRLLQKEGNNDGLAYEANDFGNTADEKEDKKQAWGSVSYSSKNDALDNPWT